MAMINKCFKYKKPFDAKDFRNNLCEKFFVAKVLKHWLKSEEVKGV